MSVRTRWAVAALLVATAASVSNAYAQPKPGQGSIGARLGVPYFLADKDTKDGQRPRLLIQGNFGYRFSPGWRLMTDFGFGWVGYKAETLAPYKVVNRTDSVSVKQDMLTKIVPINATLIKVLNPGAKKWSPYVGAGVTINRMEIVNQRRKIQDPATFQPWVKWAPGFNAILGTEYFMPAKPTVSLDWSLRYTQLFSKDTKKFPSGFTGNDAFLNASFGVNVHFWPGGKPIEVAEPTPEVAPETLAPAPADTSSTPTPAPPDTSSTPTPAPPDTSSPAPPDTSSAPGDTTQHAPQSLLRLAPDDGSFGAFGVTLPNGAHEADACIIEEKRNLR